MDVRYDRVFSVVDIQKESMGLAVTYYFYRDVELADYKGCYAKNSAVTCSREETLKSAEYFTEEEADLGIEKVQTELQKHAG